VPSNIFINYILLFIALNSALKAEFAVSSYRELRSQSVVRQTYEESCGAASIATLINNLDFKNISEKDTLEQMRENHKDLNTDMVSFKQLQDAAAKLGYESKGYQISRELLNKLNIPVLVRIENDPRYPHFVVVINHPGDFITVLDPSFGKYISSKNEFYSVWDKNNQGGYALILAPNNDFKREYNIELPNKSLFQK